MKFSCLNIFSALLLFTFTVCNCYSQVQRDEILHVRIVDLSICNSSISSTLEKVSKDYKVPIGLELTTAGYDDASMINLDIVDSSLEEVLTLMLEQNSNYKIEIHDGVINFVPIKHRSKVLRDLMGVNIKNFDPNPKSTIVDFNDYIADLPEVEGLFKNENPFRFRTYDSLPSISRLPILKTKPIYNTNFLTILNETVKINDSKFWKVFEVGEDFISIVF